MRPIRARRLRLASIRSRLTLWNVGVLALVLVVLGATLHYVVAKYLVDAVDRELSGQTHSVAALVSRNYDQWLAHRSDRFPPLPVPTEGVGTAHRAAAPRVAGAGAHGPLWPSPTATPDQNSELISYRPCVLDRSARPLASFSWPRPWDAHAFAVSLRGQEVRTTVLVAGHKLRVCSAPLLVNGVPQGVVQFAHPLADTLSAVQGVSRALLTLIPVALLVAGFGGAFLTDRALRPVRQVTQAAGQIEAQSLSGRLPVWGHDEFSDLAATINGMLGRLEEAFTQIESAYEQQRRFTADASHELRTPLTVIKANASLALSAPRTEAEYCRALTAVDRAADMTGRIIQDLLLLARSDAGQSGRNTQPIHLAEAIDRAIDPVEKLGGAIIRLGQMDRSILVRGDLSELARVFTNLLENALRYTPPDGSVTVSLERRDAVAIACVIDTGEGIPPEHLPHVCERFYRVDAARTRAQGGSGLGLAICKSIVEANHGTLELRSQVGRGTIAVIMLPCVVSDGII